MDAVDEVKQRLSIEDVVSEYIQLKRAGRNWRGLSPWTNEKTPSLMVSPEKQIWHDFSSGKGGNMFSFVMEMEGLDFKEALELLARKAGVDIDQYKKSPGSRGPNKERLYSLMEAATHFYQVQFSRHQTALQYVLKKRQFSKETALTFKLGYAPDNKDALIKFLRSKNFTLEEIRAAGMSTQRYGEVQDMFRGRLMIPLQDAFGKVIGFTARLLSDLPNAPKYINTPQTILYDKSRHVYGLHLAKDAIRKSKFVVLVEGNLDVIASHQAGVKQVVATAGTALTEAHLKALSRFSPDVRLSFDQDKAGLQATERAIPIAGKVGVSLSIIDVPSGKDPDELTRQDPNLWKQIVQEHHYALDWLIDRYKKLLDVESAQGKRQFSDVLLPVVANLPDAVEQDHYLNAIAKMIGVGKEALRTKLSQTKLSDSKTPGRRHTSIQPVDRKSAEDIKAQDHFLALMFVRPDLRSMGKTIKDEMLFSDPAKGLLKFLQANPDFDSSRDKTVQNLAEYSKILVLQFEELYQGLEQNELRYEATRLRARLVENFVKNQKSKIAAQLHDADDKKTQNLLTQAKQLDTLLKDIAGELYGEKQAQAK